MQKKQQSQAQQRSAEMQLIKAQILQMVGLTSDEYNEMQYACGLSYLAMKVNYEVCEERIQRSLIFWAWWMNNWAIREEYYLEQSNKMEVDENGIFTLQNFSSKSDFLLLHNAYHLVSVIDCYGDALSKSFSQILQLINNEAIKQSL